MKFVNIGCGESFITDKSWVNLDYLSNHPSVKQGNLLEKLPFINNSVDVIYSSHFLEHIPPRKVPLFLQECYRILKSNGKIRLVLPDLENLCKEYIQQREKGNHEKANFCLLEIIDQCVRKEPGGYLANYHRDLKNNYSKKNHMIEYVKYRTGKDILVDSSQQHNQYKFNYFNKQLLNRLKNKITKFWILSITTLLPKAFREQNISYTPIGENHAWMWDLYTLSCELNKVGFQSVARWNFNSSGISDFPLFPLDITDENLPRKGHGSMYIEATKP